MSGFLRIFCTFLSVLAAASARAAPPVVEISDARPLFVFRAPEQGDVDAAAYAEGLVRTWYQLPEAIRECGAYGFDLSAEQSDLVEFNFLFDVLHGSEVAVCATVAQGDRALSPGTIGDLFALNPNLAAIHADRIPLPTAESYGGIEASDPSPEQQWLTRVLDLCADRGRFLSVEWSAEDLLRILSDRDLEPLYHTLRYYAPYAVLTHPMENPTVLTATGALMGLWLEGAAAHWGVSLSPDWYRSTDFVRPGEWGARDAGAHAPPPPVYRAMMLAGAMGGATVYRFDEADDLWFGPRGYQWAEAIGPTLHELIDLGAIPRKDLVARSVRAAYQCGTEEESVPVHAVLNEVNAAYGAGQLERAVYGAAAPRPHPDLFPNRGDSYLVPLISPYAGTDARPRLGRVIVAGQAQGSEAWARLVRSLPPPESEGAATLMRVGRSVFVMHNRENGYEPQRYRIPDMPAPVRGVKARRTLEGVELEWPFRENDFAYTVYRRVLPELTFVPIARNIDVRTYVDAAAPPDETVGYALTALTNEPEPLEGAVNWGEYRVYSAAVSRIEEEVLVLPETEIAISAPVTVVGGAYPDEQPFWPAIRDLSEEKAATALEVARRLELLQQAVAAEDASVAAALYAQEYRGADNSNTAFVARVFEAFFDRYARCELFIQAQGWQVETEPEPLVRVSAYVHLSGVDAPANRPKLRTIARKAALTFGQRDGDWRIISAEPPFPALVDAAP